MKNNSFPVRRILLAVILIVLIFSAAKFIRIDRKLSETNDESEKTGYVFITVDYSVVFEDGNYSKLSGGMKYAGVLDDSGYFAYCERIYVSSEDSVFDVLYNYCLESDIPFDFQSSYENLYGACYVRGIGGLYEGEICSSSGWKYSVDGVYPDVGMNEFYLSGGEEIVVEFSLNQ